ncbi:MAG: MFS transporter [Acidimicrobiales bacterium]
MVVARSSSSPKEREPLPKGFWTLWSTVAVDLVGFGIVLPILPQYAESFGATPAVIGVLVASFSLAQLVFAPIWGRLSDKVGRKPVLIISLFGTAIGSLLTGLAGSLALLFAARILDGASGASVSVAQASAADLAPPRQRAKLMGLLGAAFGVGFVAGPALGALGSKAGIHVPFFLAAAISFVNALVAIVRLPETSPAKLASRAAADRGAAATVAAADRSAVVEVVDEAEVDADRIAAAPALDGPGIVEPGHLEEPVPVGAGQAAHAAGGGARDHLGAESSVGVDVRGIIRLIVVAFVAMIAFAGFEATFALLGDRRFGFDQATTGMVFAGIGLALVAVQGGMVGPVSQALGESTVLRVGLVANAVGLGVLAIDGGWTTLLVALLLLVVGQGLLTPTLSSAVAGRAGRQPGQWLGWQQSAGGLARVAGPVAAGVLFEQVGIAAPYVVGAVLVLVALALVP